MRTVAQYDRPRELEVTLLEGTAVAVIIRILKVKFLSTASARFCFYSSHLADVLYALVLFHSNQKVLCRKDDLQ